MDWEIGLFAEKYEFVRQIFETYHMIIGEKGTFEVFLCL